MRNGKIATLPANILDQLNQRLENAEDGPALLDWLNALPEVQTHLAKCFDAVPISKQNLSQWRLGGFREWQLRCDLDNHACDLAQAAAELDDVLDMQAFSGHLAASLATRYAALLNTWDGEPSQKLADQLRLLHSLTRDVALLQKTLHQSAQQVRQRDQQDEADFQGEVAAAKKKILNPIWAARQEATPPTSLVGGKAGERLAKIVTAVNFDLPFPKVDLTPDADRKPKPPAAKAKKKAPRKARSDAQNADAEPPPSHPRLPRQSHPVKPIPQP